MRSMTGFGKSEITLDGRKLRVEIKTVNHRFLDINIRLPRFLMFLEEHARNVLKENIARGRVDVYINYSSEREDAKSVTVDMALASAYIKAGKEIAGKTGIEDDLTLSHVIRMPDVITYEDAPGDDEELTRLLDENLKCAVAELNRAREKEGEQLKKDVVLRLDLILKLAGEIEKQSETVVEEYKKKLKDRLAELLEGVDVDEHRLMQEVAVYADRCNITEEIVRIKSHVKQFRRSADETSAAPLGRNMDFIVQELNREFNTIGSKAQNTDIIKHVIAGKGEIEKIREQIQNIE